MSAVTDRTRIASLEASLRSARKHGEELGYRIQAIRESEAAKRAGMELTIQRLEDEVESVKKRRNKLILEMCDMEERLIAQTKEIKALRAQVEWLSNPEEPSSGT